MLFDVIVHGLKKLEKVRKLGAWVHRLLQRNEQTPFLKILITRYELFKNVKRRKVCFSPGSPRGNRKPPTVRNQCGVFGGAEAESSIKKSSQTGFVISGMTTLSVNNGGFRTKTLNHN